VVENVAEFLNWKLFETWKQALETYGYTLTSNILDAADFGVPQHRERVFLVASKGKAITIESPELEHVPARSFIDLESGSWSPLYKPGRAAATIARAEAGRREFGDEPFLAPYYGNGSGKKGRSLDRPIGTVTTRDRWSLHHGDRMRMLTAAEYRAAMGFPETYELATSRKKAIHLLGNAVCPPVAAEVIRQAEAA
jgi:DNA (cytosine-5)-methyltransferase 1